MSQSTDHLSDAGKITILTTFLGVVIFAGVFLFNIGEQTLKQVGAAEYATTSVTVLNTPPAWTGDAQERYESSTSTPTDAGNVVSWVATGTDANSERYYLLICSNTATPTANALAAPTCAGGTQWAVSASTTSGTMATAATTSLTAWSETNDWTGWICDGNAGTPRCNSAYKNGSTTPTLESPFVINHRPVFTVYSDTSPADPGSVVTFYSTSSDPDSLGGADTVRLFVCNLNDFSTTTNNCGPGGGLASTTVGVTSNASSSYTVVIPTQDQNYSAYGFIIDEHGFEATGGAHGTDSTLSVNNVAPTISTTIPINGGSDMVLTIASGQTTGFALQFTAIDANSCQTAASTSEIVGYVASVYRSGITTCDGSAGSYNANNCYPSGVGTTTWNLNCTLDTNSCFGALDQQAVYNCTFPLWYIADPTDGTATSTQYPLENWLAVVQGIDDDFATGSKATSTAGQEVTSFLAFALNTVTIPYGSLEPGTQTDPIVATTTMAATGNIGLDERLSGESMCPTYQTGVPCQNSASSTINADEQVYGTSTVAYASGVALSSTTVTELESNVPKSTATSTNATADTFWGIRIPSSISLSGNYTGENTFIGIGGESANW